MAVSEFDFKRGCLKNTLMSISRQITSFNFELCVIGDVTGHSNLEKYITDHFKINKNNNLLKIKVKDLKKKLGFTGAPAKALGLTSKSSSKIIILASDCMMLQNDILEKLYKNVSPKSPVFAESTDVHVEPDFYKNFTDNAKDILKNWDNLLLIYPNMVSRHNRKAWLFFSGAAMKEDLLELGYDNVSCDAVLWQKMMPLNYNAKLIKSANVAHQVHSRSDYGCPHVTTCKFYCSRTAEFRGAKMNVKRRDFKVIG